MGWGSVVRVVGQEGVMVIGARDQRWDRYNSIMLKNAEC